MSMEPSNIRKLALSRHYDAALEKGALLVAVARCRLSTREPLHELRRRHHVQLVELLNDFCYNARKAIELAEEFESGIVDHANRISTLGYAEQTAELGMEGKVPLANQSLWWVLGRVIHSRQVLIREREDMEVGSKWAAAPRITSYKSAMVFAVRSDHDSADELHHVRAERIVETFLALRDRFINALKTAQACHL